MEWVDCFLEWLRNLFGLYPKLPVDPTEPTEPPAPDGTPVPAGSSLAEAVAALGDEGGTLILEEGDYEIDARLDIGANTSIIGADGAVIKSAAGIGSRLLVITGSNVTLDKLVIDGSDTPGESMKAIFTEGSSLENIVITNNTFLDIPNDAIDLSNCISPVVTGNKISGVTDNGIRIGFHNSPASKPALVQNNVIDGHTTTNGSIWIESGEGYIIVSNNTIKGVESKPGIGSSDVKTAAIHMYQISKSSNILVENNTITDCQRGISVYKYDAELAGDKLVIRNNTITNLSNLDHYSPSAGALCVVEIANSGVVTNQNNHIGTNFAIQ